MALKDQDASAPERSLLERRLDLEQLCFSFYRGPRKQEMNALRVAAGDRQPVLFQLNRSLATGAAPPEMFGI